MEKRLVGLALKLGDELLPRSRQGHPWPVVQQETVLVALPIGTWNLDLLLEHGRLRKRGAEILEALEGQRVVKIDPRIGLPPLERFRDHALETRTIQILHDLTPVVTLSPRPVTI